MNNTRENHLVENFCEVDIYKLTKDNEEDIIGAASCIAECFSGIEINGVKKSEPMNIATKIERPTVFKFVLLALENWVNQGFCYVAKDKKTGNIVGSALGEIYDPEFEIPKYSGEFEGYNAIFDALKELDKGFEEYIYEVTGEKIKGNQYLHINVIGIKVKGINKNILQEFVAMFEKDARESGLMGVFLEATNPKSQKPFMEKYGYVCPVNSTGKEAALRYKNYNAFKEIPEEMAVDCKLLFKFLM